MPQNNTSTGVWTVSANYIETAASAMTLHDLTTDVLEELTMANMARPKAHDEEAIRTLMKKRHLIKPERDQLHNPEPDFIESSRGESCRSACTLDVSDIIIKHKLK